MGFSRQEEWSGLPCLPPGDLPDPGIELTSHHVSCIGRWVLYCYSHLRSPPIQLSPLHLAQGCQHQPPASFLERPLCPGARVSRMPPSGRPCKHHCGWCVQSSIQMSHPVAPLAWNSERQHRGHLGPDCPLWGAIPRPHLLYNHRTDRRWVPQRHTGDHCICSMWGQNVACGFYLRWRGQEMLARKGRSLKCVNRSVVSNSLWVFLIPVALYTSQGARI